MHKLLYFFVGTCLIYGCLSSKGEVKIKVKKDFDIRDTTMYIIARNNSSLSLNERIDIKINSFIEWQKRKTIFIIKNRYAFDIWVSQNNLTETKDSTLLVNYSPDLSLLSPLRFRQIKSRKSILFEIAYPSGANQLELALCFMHHPEYLKITRPTHQTEKVIKQKNYLFLPLSLVTKENSFLFYVKNFPLDDVERVAEIQIIK